ncbi:hypothetical protein [Corynebacterium variabile]|uniref:hypothetical protein n=1 Tax=Corynebacterium variabile TaxID=1727 RepID=UPI0028D20A41|nr:hypothetical protein [Corynebacterium variabile]
MSRSVAVVPHHAAQVTNLIPYLADSVLCGIGVRVVGERDLEQCVAFGHRCLGFRRLGD